MQNKEQNKHFTILSSDATKGDGGYGAGTIDLNNVTPIIVSPEDEDIFIDMDALHGRSTVEKRVKFKPEKNHAGENPKRYWIVWIALTSSKSGPYYSGCTACEVLISREERRIKYGYKSMPEHVNSLDKALKNKFILTNLDPLSKRLLKNFLKGYDTGFWERSSVNLKEELEL
ncbi:YwhD family protein [Bacillus sp. AK031]